MRIAKWDTKPQEQADIKKMFLGIQKYKNEYSLKARAMVFFQMLGKSICIDLNTTQHDGSNKHIYIFVGADLRSVLFSTTKMELYSSGQHGCPIFHIIVFAVSVKYFSVLSKNISLYSRDLYEYESMCVII